jgi:hypothetical protein
MYNLFDNIKTLNSFHRFYLLHEVLKTKSDCFPNGINRWLWISQSQSYFTTSGLPPISSSWRQTPWDSRPVILFLQRNTSGYNTYVTSSLMRGWVCRLQLLLVLASAVILRSESRGTHDHIFLSQIWDSPNLENLYAVDGASWGPFVGTIFGLKYKLYRRGIGDSLVYLNWENIT